MIKDPRQNAKLTAWRRYTLHRKAFPAARLAVSEHCRIVPLNDTLKMSIWNQFPMTNSIESEIFYFDEWESEIGVNLFGGWILVVNAVESEGFSESRIHWRLEATLKRRRININRILLDSKIKFKCELMISVGKRSRDLAVELFLSRVKWTTSNDHFDCFRRSGHRHFMTLNRLLLFWRRK